MTQFGYVAHLSGQVILRYAHIVSYVAEEMLPAVSACGDQLRSCVEAGHFRLAEDEVFLCSA